MKNGNYLKQLLSSTINFTSNVILREHTFITIFFTTVFLESLWYNICFSATITNSILWTIVETPYIFLVAYISAAICNIVGKYSIRLKYILSILLLIAILLPTIVEAYVLKTFDTYITSTIIAFALQTNSEEANGFIQAFILNKDFAISILGGGIACSIFIYGIYRVISFILDKYYEQLKVIIFAVICISLVAITPPYIKLINTKLPVTALFRTIKSYNGYIKSIEEEHNINYDTGITDINNDINSNIVVVIGESFSKYHSSLYGYEKITNPALSQYIDSNNLYIFDDVISPYNATHKMLKVLLSMYSTDSEMNWNEYPLWANIFKDAGYYVTFVSNQVSSLNDDHCTENEIGSYFFQIPTISEKSFDYRNNQLYQYDYELISAESNNFFKSNNSLTIIQLKGQHIYAKYNFPEEYAVFTSNDYADGNGYYLNTSQKQEIADYDNATLYNDYVLSQIIDVYKDTETIIIFLSDHSDEVHDYRACLGRTHAEIKTAEEIKYQYEIPFMIYVTDKYKQRYPDIINDIIHASALPFMSDDIGHLILGLGNFNCKWYDQSRDCLSPMYNSKRIRLIEDKQVYRKTFE